MTGGHNHFIKRVNEIYVNKYTYPEQYKGSLTEIQIMCPIDGHGIFKRLPKEHLRGEGCPKCSKLLSDSKGIINIKEILTSLTVDFEDEKKFDGLIHESSLRFDVSAIPLSDSLMRILSHKSIFSKTVTISW